MFQKIDKAFELALNTVVVIAQACLVALVLAQVYVRFFTVNSLTWSEELSTFTMIWMVLLGSILVFRSNGHIWVENFVDIMPPSMRKIALVLGDLACIVFFLLMMWGAYRLIPNASIQLSPALKIPMSVIYMALPVSMVFSAIYAVRNLVVDIVGTDEKEKT